MVRECAIIIYTVRSVIICIGAGSYKRSVVTMAHNYSVCRSFVEFARQYYYQVQNNKHVPQVDGSPGEGQSNSQGTRENSGQSEEEGQDGGHTSDNTGGSSGGGGGGDDRRDRRKGGKGGYGRKEEDEEEREAEEVAEEKEGEAAKVLRGEGLGEGEEKHDAAELVEGKGEEEEEEVGEMVGDEMQVIKLEIPGMDGGHEPHQEQWCLPDLNLLPPACKSGNHSPHFPLKATINPRPLAAAPVLPFPGKASASMTQQGPHSLPHSDPVSSTPPSSVHSSDFALSVHEKFEELVTGVTIPVRLLSNNLYEGYYLPPGGGETEPSSSPDQVQSTIPFHSLASPYDHHLANNIVFPIHDENTNSSDSDFERTLFN